jgi:hypothetical protein
LFDEMAERTMTIGNVLYLVLSLGMFGTFSAMLAWQTWQQTSRERVMRQPQTEHRDTGHEVSA